MSDAPSVINVQEMRNQSMAESVTRHAQISISNICEYLICGIDTLDVGFYVNWSANWEDQKKRFDERKLEAHGTDGNLIDITGIRPHIFYPGGKAPNYRYHVKYPEYHAFIAISKSATQSPNIYISFTSEALHWEHSEHELIDLVKHDIESLGGHTITHKISRCDLYADFRISGGLNLDFMRSHMVGRAKNTSQFMNGDQLETFYAGNKSSPIQIRIYDKGKEIKKKGSEGRWLLLWFIDDSQDVWRIEAQIRRQVLKQFRINKIDDLIKKKADLWRYITHDWFSLRNQDNENQARRTVHELWKNVQSCVKYFGAEEGTKRHYEENEAASIDWYMARIKNNLIACAAIKKDYDLESCLQKINNRMLVVTDKDDFAEKARIKSIELGISIKSEDKQDVRELFRRLTAN